MRLILIRHGQSEGNVGGIVQGHLDFGLTDLGRQQSEHTARYLRGFRAGRILSSPMARARETAAPIATELGAAIEIDAALAEYDAGEITGLTGREIRERYAHVFASAVPGERLAFPGQEGRDAFLERVGAFLEHARADGRDTVAIAHGGIVNAACHLVLGVDYRRPGVFRVANCSVTELASDRSGQWVLLRQNDICHLEGIETFVDRG